MKLSFTTLSFDAFDIDKLIDICKKGGYEGIEFRTDHGWCQRTLSDSVLADAGKKLKDAGITVVGLGSSINLRNYSEEVLEEYKGNLRLARFLNAKGIRIMVGTFRHYSTLPLKPMDYPAAVTCMQEMCDLGLNDGVNLCVEAHNEYDTGKVLAKLLKDVNRPNCKIIWDILHTLFHKETPEETYQLLGENISHLHIKDGITDANPASLEYIYTPIGKGEIKIGELIKFMESKGKSDLFYSLEWEPKWKPELEVLNLDDETVLMDYAEYMRSQL